MAERSLANPLSGEEIVKAVLDKVGHSLRRDCFLNPDTAYGHFSAKVSIRIEASDVGRVAVVEQSVEASHGESDGEEESLESSVELEIEPGAPNEVRVETGQPVPTLARDDSGKSVVKHVSYARPGKKAARG